MFADIAKAPAVQSLARRVEDGGVLTCAGICASAQPFLAALLRHLFPQRPIVAVTDNLKTQESFHADLETWLRETRSAECGLPSVASGRRMGVRNESTTPASLLHSPSSLFFYPAWEVLPQEGRLPHADTISDRLATLVALSEHSALRTPHSALIVASVTALLQKTFAPDDLHNRTRRLQRGDKINPLDLVEWLEEQGYEPEAQVTQKGEIALRGGILDLWPLTSPWPVRLEFFGDELESLRYFDPLTQISREETTALTLPPGGELGILQKMRLAKCEFRNENSQPSPLTSQPHLATLLDYLLPNAIFLLCEPEPLAARADEYAQQISENDPLFTSWPDLLAHLDRKAMARLEICEAEVGVQALACSPGKLKLELQRAGSEIRTPFFASLEAFRPLADRAPDPQIVEAQRREFFHQLHRWRRQDYAVHVFCNNDGERQRFGEIWQDMGLGSGVPVLGKDAREAQLQMPDPRPQTRIGTLSRGFLCDEAKLVVVTDAEIFGAGCS